MAGSTRKARTASGRGPKEGRQRSKDAPRGKSAVPAYLSQPDVQLMRWILEHQRSRGAPTATQVLAHLGPKTASLFPWSNRGLLRLDGSRALLTRNGLRATGDAGPELLRLRVVVPSFLSIWNRERGAFSAAAVAKDADVSEDAVLSALDLVPELVAVEASTPARRGFLRRREQYAEPDLDRMTSLEWELETPMSMSALLARFDAGERSYERVEIREAPFQHVGDRSGGGPLRDLRGLRVTGGELTGVLFHGCDFREATFESLFAGKVGFIGCDLRGASLRGVDLRGGGFVRCNCEGMRADERCNFRSMLLEGSRFTRATLVPEGVRFEGSAWTTIVVDGEEVGPPTTNADVKPEESSVVSEPVSDPHGRLVVHRPADSPLAELRFDGKVRALLDLSRPGPFALAYLASNANRFVHVLELLSAFELGELKPVEASASISELVAAHCPRAYVPKDPTERDRKLALLRRLALLASRKSATTTATRAKHRNSWPPPEESERIQTMLEQREPFLGLSTTDSVLGRPLKRFRPLLLKLCADLSDQHPEIRPHLSTTNGPFALERDFWRYQPDLVRFDDVDSS